jgi:MSHA biogenesis protein MshO
MRSPTLLKANRGFTLVEMVAVIVLLGVLGAATTSLISSSVRIYNDTARRDNLSQMGRFAVERVSREVRDALPGSVRAKTQAGTHCLEFMPIKAASSYLGRVSDNPPVSTVTAVDFTYAFAAGDSIAIYTVTNNDVYAPGSKAIAAIASVSAASSDTRTITLASANRFPNESPIQRFYIVNDRVSFCAVDGQLSRYQGYSASGDSQPMPPSSGGVLLAEDIRLQDGDGNAVDVFEFSAGTLQRAGIAHLKFNFSDAVVSDEWVHFNQDVSVRNTP